MKSSCQDKKQSCKENWEVKWSTQALNNVLLSKSVA